MRTDMLNLSTPKRTSIMLSCVFVLDGGTVVRRFVAVRGRVAERRAETYRQKLIRRAAKPCFTIPARPARRSHRARV